MPPLGTNHNQQPEIGPIWLISAVDVLIQEDWTNLIQGIFFIGYQAVRLLRKCRSRFCGKDIIAKPTSDLSFPHAFSGNPQIRHVVPAYL